MHQTPTAPFLFTIDDVDRMVAAGIFDQRSERVELIEGQLRTLSPASEEHDDVIQYLDDWSHRVVANHYRVRVQQGIRLLQGESMPEPDVYWVESRHRRGRPTSDVVALIIEVAVSSLEYDLTLKQRLYAIEQIPEYWVVDPTSETIVVHTRPEHERYGEIETFRLEQNVAPRCLPDATLNLHWLFRE